MKINFEPKEKILYQLRKHWFAFVGRIIGAVILILLPIGVIIALIKFDVHIPLSPFLAGSVPLFIIFCYAGWLLFVWITLFVQWTNFYLDVWYLTDTRIIDTNQKRLFGRGISSFYYNKIQDITVEVDGVIATFLDFGNVSIETAGEREDITLKNAAHPQKVKQIVNERMEVLMDRVKIEPTINDAGV